jgi:cation:H+ antiporter
MLNWLAFAACSGVIVLTGVRLSRYGDAIAEKSGMGGTWIGVVLLASITSLPELVNGVSASAIFWLPDLAAGDVFGSCLVNLLILSLLDVGGGTPLSSRIHQAHVLSASFGLLLLGVASLGLLADVNVPSIGWVGLPTLALLGLYGLAMNLIFRFERARMTTLTPSEAAAPKYESVSFRRVLVLYSVNGIILSAAAVALAPLGERIATQTGWGETLVGTLLIALSTSLPEVVVSFAAARIGALDLAVGNLFGSNLFNLAILGLDDLIYTPGPLFGAVSRLHVIPVVGAMTMTGIAVIGLTFRASKRRLYWSWDAIGLAVVYAFTLILLASHR